MDIYCTSDKHTFTLICCNVLLIRRIVPYTILGAVYKAQAGFYLFCGLCFGTYYTLTGIFNFKLGSLHFNTETEEETLVAL